MKISSKYLLHTAAALLLSASFASCADDDMTVDTHTVLQPGEYPLSLTASVGEMTSRSEGKDSWTDGDSIAVRIGGYPNVGCYMLNSDGTVMSAVKSLDWHTINPTYVEAWFPYVDLDQVMTVSVTDQSEGLKQYDFLTATTSPDQIYTKAVNLNFKHQMAKISCKVLPDDGISDGEWESVKVSIAGFSKASFRNGNLSAGDDNNSWITPVYDAEASAEKMSVYEALVVPQDMAGKDLIKIDIDVNSNNNLIHKSLIYKATDGNANFEAGTHYKFTVTVKKDRIEVQSLSASWTDEGKWHPAEPAIFRVNMPKDHGQELIYSDNVIEKNEDYILVQGNRFDISYVVNNENIKNALRLVGDSDRDRMSRDVVGDRYVFSYYLLSEEVTLEYVEYIQVGDYYYDDGTWGHPKLKGRKKPVGIIFRSGAGVSGANVDVPENYGTTLSTIHGYAVAMHDATGDACIWGAGGNGAKFSIPGITFYKSYAKENYPYTGYNYTQYIVDWGITGNLNYEAAEAVTNYRMSTDVNDPAAPKQSSGWYLPTVEQLIDIEKIPDRAQAFEDAEGEDLITNKNLSNGRYWTCIVGASNGVYVYRFDGTATMQNVNRNPSNSQKVNNICFVRAVLTF